MPVQYWNPPTATALVSPINTGTSVTPTDPLYGIYYGSPSGSVDPVARTQAGFGATPQMVSGYIQQSENFDLSLSGGQTKRDIYRAVMDQGVSVYITLASKDQHTYSHNDFATEVVGAVAVRDQWAAFCADMNTYAKSVGVRFYTGWESEFEVKVNAGEITGVTEQTFAASHDKFVTACKAADATLQTVYQVGHFDDTAIRAVLAAKTVETDVFGLDPYRGGTSSSHTARETVNSKNLTPAILRADTDFNRLFTQGRIALTEYGANVPQGDASIAAYISSTVDAVTTEDLEFTLWFNSDSGPNNNSKMDGKGLTQSEAAMAALIDQP